MITNEHVRQIFINIDKRRQGEISAAFYLSLGLIKRCAISIFDIVSLKVYNVYS